MAGSVALDLFVLTSQAAWTPAVVAFVRRTTWSADVSRALVESAVALAAGYALMRGLVRGAGIVSLARRSAGPALAVLPVLVVAGLFVGLLVGDASNSPYVLPVSQPTLAVTVSGNRIMDIRPASMAAGRIEVWAAQTAVRDADLILTTVLPVDRQAALLGGRIQYGYLRGSLPVNPAGTLTSDPSSMSGLTDFSTPGTYALVVSRVYSSWQPPDDWDGWVPILDARTFVIAVAAAIDEHDGELASQLCRNWEACPAINEPAPAPRGRRGSRVWWRRARSVFISGRSVALAAVPQGDQPVRADPDARPGAGGPVHVVLGKVAGGSLVRHPHHDERRLDVAHRTCHDDDPLAHQARDIGEVGVTDRSPTGLAVGCVVRLDRPDSLDLDSIGDLAGHHGCASWFRPHRCARAD